MEHESRISRRSSVVAGILAFLCTGLGYLYAGRPRRAVLYALLAQGALLLAVKRGWIADLDVFLAFLIGGGLLLLVTVIDSARIARSEPDYVLRPCNRWYVYLLFLAAFGILPGLLVRGSGGVGAYRIPTQSMSPTLVPGDRILVDRTDRSATPGTVVVFLSTEVPGQHQVKRVAGRAGDRVVVRDGKAIVNGEPLEEPYIGRPGGTDCDVVVPDGQIFLLGDNRGLTRDSRMYGPVPVENVVGRVTCIWWSEDESRIGTRIR